ncbi:MAG: sugar transferase, partial [Solirubrobacterales bacterium]|nr:sugar transferase [Solirubrobacterales bacterium]
VKRGQLSLVGPRHEQPGIVERLESAITKYPARQTVRPGLTGWAQINHGYGGSLQGAAEKLEYDLYYIKHQSLALDVRIIAATVRTVLAGGGE